MTEPTWVPVAPADDVTTPPWPCHDVGGVTLRLVRSPDGAIHAVAPACPHLDAPLDRAVLEGEQVLCPRHWYAWEIATGRNVHPGLEREGLGLPVYPVEVRDGIVHVALPAAP